MAEPVNSSDQKRRARRYEANFRRFGRSLARFTGGAFERRDGVEVYAAPLQTVFNAFLPPRWTARTCEARLETALSLYARTGRGLDIIVGPSTEAIAGEGKILTATWEGERTELSDKNLLKTLLTHPLLTLKIIGGIHWEALKLWIKGAKYISKPEPPSKTVS